MKKQIIALLGIGTLAYLSAKPLLMETRASLTAPTGYEIGYLYYDNPSPAPDFWALNFPGNTSYQDPAYTRTADGVYYNYTHTFSRANYPALPYGLTITNTFNRSNTSWTATGTGLFYPTESKIGSAANYVGSGFNNRIQLTLDNQTNKNYVFWLDISSSSTDYYFDLLYDNSNYYFYDTDVLFSKNTLKKIYLPAYTQLQLNTLAAGSIAMYFDAWYLDDLGVSSAYTNGQTQGEQDGYAEGYTDGLAQETNQNYDNGFNDGYDEGYDDGLNATASDSITWYGAIFSSAFGAVASIYNINVFGNLTLGTLIIAPIAVSLLWFILGIVSGVGGKKQ